LLKCVNLSILQKTINKTSKSPHAFAMCSIRTRSPQSGKRENWQFVDLSRLQFTSDESEFIPDYIAGLARLVIGTHRTVGSAKKFVRITSGFGGGEFPKTLRKVCTCQKLKFAFLPLEYCKIRECYAVANAFTIRNMYSLLLSVPLSSFPWILVSPESGQRIVYFN
jgi:hypothetical protein